MEKFKWDAFISHASEDKKDVAIPLTEALESKGLKIWLDKDELSVGSSLRRGIDEGLANSRFGIVILSKHFFNKEWPKKELDALVARDDGREKVILPVWHKISFLDIKKYSPLLADKLAVSTDRGIEFVVEELIKVLNKESPKQEFIPSNDGYYSAEIKGTVSFDYSNNNGRYCIGKGSQMFELNFSKASNRAIYLLNDPVSIEKVAVVKDVSEINLIEDASKYDGSSRTRRTSTNQIAILQNTNEFYAAIKILEIEDDTRGADYDKVTFDYYIQTNGSPNFSSIK